MSPRIINVAVPLPKHSPMFGQEASSQTVWRFWSRRICLISVKREFELAALTRIQGGFLSVSLGTILMAMREVFACPFSFTPASRMAGFQKCANPVGQTRTQLIHAGLDPEVTRLRH